MVLKRNEGMETPKGEMATPQKLYNFLDEEFFFDADAAANSKNAKHDIYFSKSMDSLRFSWGDMIEKPYRNDKDYPSFFLNPDYSRGIIDKFTAKARQEARKGSVVVSLLPVSTDTGWWNRNISSFDGKVAVEVRHIEGRVHYIGYTTDGKIKITPPPFSSCIVIFCRNHPYYWNQDRDPVMPIWGKTIVLKDLK